MEHCQAHPFSLLPRGSSWKTLRTICTCVNGTFAGAKRVLPRHMPAYNILTLNSHPKQVEVGRPGGFPTVFVLAVSAHRRNLPARKKIWRFVALFTTTLFQDDCRYDRQRCHPC